MSELEVGRAELARLAGMLAAAGLEVVRHRPDSLWWKSADGHLLGATWAVGGLAVHGLMSAEQALAASGVRP